MTHISYRKARGKKPIHLFLPLVSIFAAVGFLSHGYKYSQSGVLSELTVNTSWLTNYLSGEHGFMLAIVSAAAAYLFWRKRDNLPTIS